MYWRRNDSKTAVSPRSTPTLVTADSSQNWEAQHCLQAAQQVGEGPFQVTRQLGWFCFFQAVGLTSESSLLSFPPSEADSQLFLLTLEGRDLVNLVTFRDFL